MKFELDLSQIKVVAESDHKGNPVLCLDLFGHYVLYRDAHHENRSPEDQADMLNTWLPYRVARMLGELLLERDPHLAEEWGTLSPTGREVDYHDRTIQEVYE